MIKEFLEWIFGVHRPSVEVYILINPTQGNTMSQSSVIALKIGIASALLHAVAVDASGAPIAGDVLKFVSSDETIFTASPDAVDPKSVTLVGVAPGNAVLSVFDESGSTMHRSYNVSVAALQSAATDIDLEQADGTKLVSIEDGDSASTTTSIGALGTSDVSALGTSDISALSGSTTSSIGAPTTSPFDGTTLNADSSIKASTTGTDGA